MIKRLLSTKIYIQWVAASAYNTFQCHLDEHWYGKCISITVGKLQIWIDIMKGKN